jgi:hypothetical protein
LENKLEGLLINNILISSPKVANKIDKVSNHPVLNPNYILGKKETIQDKQNNFNKNSDYKICNINANKENKKNQDNKRLKEKIKDKAKNTDLLLNDNRISYKNEKIMKKIDEFDSRLFKNMCRKNSNYKQHNKEIKISYMEKFEQDHNIYLSNDIKGANKELKVIDKSKEEKKKHNNIELNIIDKISPEPNQMRNNNIQSNKNITNNKIDPVLIENLFPYSKDIYSNKNCGEAKNIFKNNYLISNVISNREGEASEKLSSIKEFSDNKSIFTKEKKIEMISSFNTSPAKIEEFSEKVKIIYLI